MSFHIHHGDVLAELRSMPDAFFDSCLTDPPYGLSFMGKSWDHGVPSAEIWAEVLRVLKPGSSLLAFGGTRTFHRLTCAIEDAGFEIRDCFSWLYGSGFPKSHDISKGIDKHGGVSIGWFGPWLRTERERRGINQKELAKHFPSKTGGLTGCVANWELGLNVPTADQFNTICRVLDLPFGRIEEAEREVLATESRFNEPSGIVNMGRGERTPIVRQITAPATPEAQRWNGYGTALKPAWEPIIVAMKPTDGTFAQNALKHGVAGLNIDVGRIGTSGGTHKFDAPKHDSVSAFGNGLNGGGGKGREINAGRWPANLLLDEESARLLDEQSGTLRNGGQNDSTCGLKRTHTKFAGDSGGASRFFYVAKASSSERETGNNHPTVKPIKLVEYLAKLILPPERDTPRRILVPFSGSGSEMIGALNAGFDEVVGIEREAEYIKIAKRRLAQTQPLFHQAAGD